MNTAFLGVDPGQSGAVAVIWPTGKVSVYDHGETLAEIADVLCMVCDSCAFEEWHMYATIERVAAMPGQGVSSVFKFGRAAGVSLGALYALGIPFDDVHPATWKKAMLGGGKHDKADSRELARRLFPSVTAELRRVKDDGRAEALLLAEYGRRLRQNG